MNESLVAESPVHRDRTAPPFAFLFLHVCLAWPTGVVGLALGSGLIRAGVPVHRAAAVIAATSLAFTFEFVWAPVVDAMLTRRTWFVIGAIVMAAALAAMLTAPWTSSGVPLLTVLGFVSCSGSAICGVAAKGIMAYDVPDARLGAASGYYTAGGTLAKAIGGAGTLWLLTHWASRGASAMTSVGVAALAGAAIFLAAPRRATSRGRLGDALLATLGELWDFLRTREGVLAAVLCVIPFGTGTESSLIGAISSEWRITPNQLAGFGLVGAVANIAGAAAAGWLSARLSAWRAYTLPGVAMIAMMILFAMAPRTPTVFLGTELSYRALATCCYAARLAIVMSVIGQGAASTKAAALWSLTNLSSFYPTLIEGAVHDHAGTAPMLLADAVLGTIGCVALIATLRWATAAAPAPPSVVPVLDAG